MKPHENQKGTELNGIRQLLFYADVNLLDGNINTIKQNKETLLNTSKDVGLQANTEQTK
jgi:hypothetical protein